MREDPTPLQDAGFPRTDVCQKGTRVTKPGAKHSVLTVWSGVLATPAANGPTLFASPGATIARPPTPLLSALL